MGPNNWGIFLILPVTTGEGIGPAGEISPVVCMLKNALDVIHSKATPYSPQRVGDIDTHIGPLVPWLLAQVANDLSIRNTGL